MARESTRIVQIRVTCGARKEDDAIPVIDVDTAEYHLPSQGVHFGRLEQAQIYGHFSRHWSANLELLTVVATQLQQDSPSQFAEQPHLGNHAQGQIQTLPSVS